MQGQFLQGMQGYTYGQFGYQQGYMGWVLPSLCDVPEKQRVSTAHTYHPLQHRNSHGHKVSHA
jgi:hypothetical protein